MSDQVDKGEVGAEGAEEVRPPVWRRVLMAPEGKILCAGIVLTIWYAVTVVLARLQSAELFHSLATMTTAHVFGGRAAGMSAGYTSELGRGVVIVANMAIETFLVLLFYPLFVFSYRRLIVIQPLEDTIARARRAAEAHQPTIVKFGVPGLLLFVWFPFWMTGPLVGCIIGFLIGLRPWVNLTVVLSGTYLAIFCWGLVLEKIHISLESLGPYVPFVFVGLILLLAISIHIRYAFSKHAPPPDESEGKEAGD
ncbi:MAG: small multi-drug export protein [Planctomycetota bacterium]|jgi:uncharacterized membrane protein